MRRFFGFALSARDERLDCSMIGVPPEYRSHCDIESGAQQLQWVEPTHHAVPGWNVLGR
jgi:hypothetical protein